MWPLIVGAAASLAGNAFNYFGQKSINDKNLDNQWRLFEAQNRRQDFLNENADLIKRNSLAKAGFNLNMDNGGYPELSTPAVDMAEQQSPHFGFSDMLQATQLEQQSKLINAQSRQLNADAEAQEILNARETQRDNVINKYYYDMMADPGDGEFVKDGVAPRLTLGRLQGEKDLREWLSRMKELDSNDVRNELDKLINDSRLKDSEIVKAISKMPYQEYNKLIGEIDTMAKNRDVMDSVINLNDSQTNLNKLEEEITRNTNLSEMIHKYLGDGVLADFAQFLLILFTGIGSRVSIGIGRNQSTNTNTSTSTSTSNITSSSRSVNHNYNHNYNHNSR